MATTARQTVCFLATLLALSVHVLSHFRLICDHSGAGAWVAQDNGTITSVMDGHCLTLASDKTTLEVSSCVAGDKAQQWVFDEKWTKSGSGHPSTVRSAVGLEADGSAAGICIDNGPVGLSAAAAAAPSQNATAASCELYSSVTSINKGGGKAKATLGGVHPSTSYEQGRGCAVTLKAADGSFLWSSPSFGSASPTLTGPAPSLVSNSTVLAVLDAPRFVPPPWGATPVPAYIDAATLPHANTSGFDLTNHADDLYLFLSPANHAEGLAGIRSEYLALSGHIPLLPKWAFGLWFTWCTYTRNLRLLVMSGPFPTDCLCVQIIRTISPRRRLRSNASWTTIWDWTWHRSIAIGGNMAEPPHPARSKGSTRRTRRFCLT